VEKRDVMTAEEKLILILRQIDDVNKGTPKGKPCKLNAYRLRDAGLDFDDCIITPTSWTPSAIPDCHFQAT